MPSQDTRPPDPSTTDESGRGVRRFIARQEGLGVTATVLRDRTALESAQPMIRQIREGALDQLSLELLDVAELEVVYAHLRVPEAV